MEYLGEIRTASEGNQILEQQEKDSSDKFYIFFLEKQHMCIDATQSLLYRNRPNYGRYINHSRKFANIKPVIFHQIVIPYIKPTLRVIFIATVDIFAGTEFLWDYDSHNKMVFN